MLLSNQFNSVLSRITTATCIVAATALLLMPARVLAVRDAADPLRFADEVAALERQDAETRPQLGAVVFIGSSNIKKWPVAKSFPGLPAVNHGFGGSQLSDSVYYFDRLVAALQPKLVVLHAGGNDLSAGRSPAQITEDLRRFIVKLHAVLPKTRLIYVGLIPAPIRVSLKEKYRETTRLIRGVTKRDRLVTVINPQPALLDSSGEIRPELYLDDRLHLNTRGYDLLTHYVIGDVNRAARIAGVNRSH